MKQKSYVQQVLIAQALLPELPKKAAWRLKRIREKYRRLKFDSHNGGAGGGKCKAFDVFDSIVQKCDELLKDLS